MFVYCIASTGLTPLMLAASKNLTTVLVELLKLGADPLFQIHGFTAVQIAQRFSSLDAKRILSDWIAGVQAAPALVRKY